MRRLLGLLLFFPIFARAQATIHISSSADTVCAGTGVIFTATVTGTPSPHFRWKVNGAAAGSDTGYFYDIALANADAVSCLLTNSAGDTTYAISDTIVMTVHPRPDAGVITGADSSVCVGASITLTASVPGGTWSTQNDFVSVAGGVVTGVTGIFEGPTPTDFVYYSVSNAWCTDTARKKIYVRPLPDALFTIGPPISSVLCVGQIYMINGGDGVNGKFFSVNGNILYGLFIPGSFSISTIHAGPDVLISVDSNSCGVDTFTADVMVLAPPDSAAISAISKNICVGDSTLLPDTSLAVQQVWSVSNQNAIFDRTTGMLKGVSPGPDTISLNAMNLCGNTRTSAVVSVNPLPTPIIGLDSILAGQSVTLSDNVPGGMWTSGNSSVVSMSASSGVATGEGSGQAIITYTLPTGCFTTMSLHTSSYKNGVSINPNISSNEIVIQSYPDINNYCTIFNSAGQMVLHLQITDPVTSIDISYLAAGVYFIKLNDNGKKIVKRFVKI